ncbi:activating transcription factor 7-interacting protein 1 [Folsomia candida]|uniref:Activating transcription factor 7-interacting protein 1 n=1 Tax=Folsomia candida TaxID=158441 RepID=A0A226EYU6_FOLCA|nr:activating transcription factor 7-interacting protein 1 [Folsomia candida]OXA62775.1 Activating transcription factor 7-interacting protein 1 [Folsomia candida]
MELGDMSLGTQEVTVISENGSGFEAGSEVGQDTESAVGDLLNEIVAKVTAATMPPNKKMKETDEIEMQVDVEEELLSSENKENILHGIRKMSRKDLEELVLSKIVEAIIKHSEVGKFRTKIFEMQMYKEKLQNRVTHLLKQVIEMGKAVKLLLDNHNRDPNNLNPNKKRPPPIKFYRSVGLQVTIEPSVRNGMSKVIHVNNVNGLPLSAKPLNGTLHNIPIKKPGPKSLTEPRAILKSSPIKNQINSNNNNNNNNALTQTVVKGLNQMNGHLSPTKVATSMTTALSSKSVSSPTVVDLTDDNVAPGPSASGDNSGVFRLVNSGVPGGYQILSNGQNRSIILGPNVSTTTTTTNMSTGRPVSVLVRPALNNRPIQIQPRAPLGIAPNRPAAVVVTSAIPNRGNAAAVIPPRPLSQQQVAASRKIQLPPLPISSVVPVPRGRVLKELPPRPTLTLNEQSDGIVLSWTMKLSLQHAEIASYQIYACQESLASSPGKTSSWKKVGDVKALPLPMACTLSQFTHGNRYFFIVRANDTHGRSGPFCEPGPIILQKK